MFVGSPQKKKKRAKKGNDSGKEPAVKHAQKGFAQLANVFKTPPSHVGGTSSTFNKWNSMEIDLGDCSNNELPTFVEIHFRGRAWVCLGKRVEMEVGEVSTSKDYGSEYDYEDGLPPLEKNLNHLNLDLNMIMKMSFLHLKRI
ncbi:hypothetical protein Sjap_022280 [Stephania japonica]|uniref:Uncharacterized protein n=1 Tax=Stephania japonica TaxID=461633 RepID=A0AAP0EUB0_9MAGN